MTSTKQIKALKKARLRERTATMKALAITFLALLGVPALTLAGCATTQQTELYSGWGYFQQVGGDSSQSMDNNSGRIVVYWGVDAPSVFQTGSHVKTFHFCDSTDAFRLNDGLWVKFKFHWDSKFGCDMVDDIEIK